MRGEQAAADLPYAKLVTIRSTMVYEPRAC